MFVFCKQKRAYEMRICDLSSDVCSSDLAKALAAEGANIVINGFGDADAIEAERAGLGSISGARAIYSNADLTKVDAIEAMMTKAGERFGGVDILINNAGMQHVDRNTVVVEQSVAARLDIGVSHQI